ncbi:MAG: hypothetical protein LBS65_03325 [Desulfovibrio sp.]|nr:hypothetical protein [Desulfovibrio sp.]
MGVRRCCAVLFFVAWLFLPSPLKAQDEPAPPLLRDDVAGYELPLPSSGWREISDVRLLEEQARRICVVFMRDGIIPGASLMRGAFLPDSAPASPALILFTLEYATLGLNAEAVKNMAEKPRGVAASLANAVQESYLELFPRSVMVNSYLGDDFFSLNLRSVLDFSQEEATTRNRHIRMTLTAHGALVLMTLYDGPPQAEYDRGIAASVRTLRILPDKGLQNVRPPFEASILDYLLLISAIFFTVYLARRFRRAMRG